MVVVKDDRVVRYVRTVLHKHPLRGWDYVGGLLRSGMSADDVTREVLLPARRRLRAMLAARQLHADDANDAITQVGRTLVRLSHNGTRVVSGDCMKPSIMDSAPHRASVFVGPKKEERVRM